MIGQTLDRYRIDAKLGEGGMGVVYRARDTHLDRPVAIKVLPRDKVADPTRKQRFVQEAKAASALNHPNIVTIHDIRSDSGIDFIVMEYVEGRTLDQIIPAKGLPVAQALCYAVQIADALARAHDAGIVHRDLKPSNVIVTSDDRAKILDFGLAKLLDRAGDSNEAATRTSPLTEAGIVVGTAAYMSPEQAEGRNVDARSDIFSFGAVLYEMVTGHRPFAGDSPLSILAKIISEDPEPPSRLAAAVPSDVERTILRCLRKDPARRFQTMADLKVVIEDLVTDSGKAAALPPPPPGSWVARRPGTIAIGGVLTGIALAAASFFFARERVVPDRSQQSRAIPITALPGVVQYPSFSPDGDRVAFTWTGPKQDNPDVYVQQIGVGAPLRLTTDPANDYSPIWSPDGRAIAFLRQTSDPRRSELRVVPPLGGTERKVTEIQPRGFLRPVTLSWCPDSRCLVLTDSAAADGSGPDVLFVVSIESGEKKPLTNLSTEGLFADTDPAVSPDGRWLVFRRDVSPFSGRLQLVELGDVLQAEGEPRRLTPLLLDAYGPRWISKTEIVFYAKSSLWRMNPFGTGAPERLPFAGEDGMMPAVSMAEPGRPGRLIYVRNYADTNVWRLDTPIPGVLTVSAPIVAISSTRRDELPQFSPDGRKVAFMSGRSGEWEVWAADVSGANAVQLTRLGANPGFPRWSPDGKVIAFHSNSEEQATGDVYVVPAEGGKPRNLTAHTATDTFPSFSRDGRWIYFSSTRGGRPSIWRIPASGGEAVQISPKTALIAIESVDGTALYFVESLNTESPGPLWRVPLDGGEPVKVLDGVPSTGFDVIDGGIYYLERLSGETNLRYFDFIKRQSTVVAPNLGNLTSGLTASRDGRTVLFSRVDSSVNDLMLLESFR